MSDRFILELKLRTELWQEHKLLKRLDAARQFYNAALTECLNRLDGMRDTKAWRYARKLPKGSEKTKAFRELRKKHELRKYDIMNLSAAWSDTWINEHVDSQTRQTIANRAFDATEKYMYGVRGRPRFKRHGELRSVESASANKPLRWKDDGLYWSANRGRNKIFIPAIIDEKDPVVKHGLDHEIAFARLIWRKEFGENVFYTQLCLKGKPLKRFERGRGTVGMDLGPSMIAVVNEEESYFEKFCSEIEDISKEKRRLKRKLDRQRRANNPDNFNKNGTIRKGPKSWHQSNRMLETRKELQEAERRLAAHRKDLHGAMTNWLVQMGDTIKTEKISYKSWQRSKKPFRLSRSVRDRAPGMFMEMLRRKADTYDIDLEEFSTYSTYLSQICHRCGQKKKKTLDVRIHSCDCGVEAHRDMYSAFLARFVEDDKLEVDRAEKAWSGAHNLLQAASSKYKPREHSSE